VPYGVPLTDTEVSQALTKWRTVDSHARSSLFLRGTCMAARRPQEVQYCSVYGRDRSVGDVVNLVRCSGEPSAAGCSRWEGATVEAPGCLPRATQYSGVNETDVDIADGLRCLRSLACETRLKRS
jgi:hypothetical protein